MKVYEWSEYLKTVRADSGIRIEDLEVLCEVEELKEIPRCPVLINNRKATACMINSNDDFLCVEFFVTNNKGHEIFLSEEITCPNCNSEVSDSWACDDSEEFYECQTCFSVFSYKREVTVSYTSNIVRRNTKTLKLKASNNHE